MIVEFIGTPGAGKTTLLATVIEYFREQGLSARTVVEAARPYAQRTLLGKAVSRLAPPSLQRPLLWQVFYYHSLLYRSKFFIKHPRLVWQVLNSQKRRPISGEARRYVLHWFFHLVGYYEFLIAYTRPDEVLVLDEGFIHRVVQLHASDVEEPNPAQVLAYIDLLPRPDLVIFPQAPWEVCEKRIYRRGLWERFRHKSPAQVSRYVTNSQRVVNLAVDYVKSRNWPVVEVDNGSDDLTASTTELSSKLIELLAGRTRQPNYAPAL